MDALEIQLANLQNKLQLLLKQSQFLVKENNNLKKEKEQLFEEINNKDELMHKMQQQIDALKINNMMDEDEKKQMEKRIDEYLREIEKCLSILNT
jgi:hypothetical protein